MPEETNLDVSAASSAASTQNGDNAKSPGLADIVMQTAKASLATGKEGLEGGGVPPSVEAEDTEAGGVQLLDTAEEQAPGEETVKEGDDNETQTEEEQTEAEEEGGSEQPETPVAKVSPKVDDTKLPFAKHPRWQQVLTQKNEAEALVKSLTPVAEAHNAVAAFLIENNVTPEQYNEGIQLMALLNTDPAAAAVKVKELMTVLAPYHAESVTSPDLLKDMEEGKITPERAQELERYRSGQKAQGVKAQLTGKQQQAAAQRERVQQLQAWDRATKAKDPSFKAKPNANAMDGLYELTTQKALQLFSEQPPTTTAQAVALCERAYTEARRFFTARTPKAKTTKRVPSSGDTSPGQSRGTAPQTLLGVVQGVANGTYKPRF